MARPLKTGTECFLFYCNFFQSSKIKNIKSRTGDKGIVILLFILCEIYTDKGYYIKCNQRFWDRICIFQNINEAEAKEIVKYMIEINYFNRNMFYRFEILTSLNIQTDYFKKTKRRKNQEKSQNKKYILSVSSNIKT